MQTLKVQKKKKKSLKMTKLYWTYLQYTSCEQNF
jgi:hypothetical protein